MGLFSPISWDIQRRGRAMRRELAREKEEEEKAMPNPYDGRVGYNLGLDHAMKAVDRLLEQKAPAGAVLVNFAVEVVAAIAQLHRTPRIRRWAKRPTDFVGGTK